MNLTISDQAIEFYKEQMNLKKGDYITFYVRIGGVGSGGFSFGISLGTPLKEYHSFEQQGLTICVTPDDKWYFDGMTIDYNKDFDEIRFTHEEFQDPENP